MCVIYIMYIHNMYGYMCPLGILPLFGSTFSGNENSQPSGIHSDIKEGFADHHITSGGPRLCLAGGISCGKPNAIKHPEYYHFYGW